MSNAVARHEKSVLAESRARERFAQSIGELGPHPIPQKRQTANEYHQFRSIKAGMSVVQCESELETQVAYWGESRSDIVGIVTQPLRIHGQVGSRPYYTLDISFIYKDGSQVFYEVKPSEQVTKHPDGSDGPPYWPLLKAWGDANGRLLEVLTEEDIVDARRCIENWRILLPFVVTAYEEPDPALESALYQLVSAAQAKTLSQLYDYHPKVDSQTITAYAGKLIHQGKVCADLDSGPLSPGLKIWAASTNDA